MQKVVVLLGILQTFVWEVPEIELSWGFDHSKLLFFYENNVISSWALHLLPHHFGFKSVFFWIFLWKFHFYSRNTSNMPFKTFLSYETSIILSKHYSFDWIHTKFSMNVVSKWHFLNTFLRKFAPGTLLSRKNLEKWHFCMGDTRIRDLMRFWS